MKQLGRRTFLKTMGSAVAFSSAANLIKLSMAEAATGGYPLRFIALWHPHSGWIENWRPKTAPGALTAASLNYDYSSLQPLDKYRSKITVIEGIDYRVLYENSCTGHGGAPCTFLTGVPTQFVAGSTTVRDASSGSARPANVTSSLDIYLAEQLGVSRDKVAALSVGFDGGNAAENTLSYGPGGMRNSSSGNPLNYYNFLVKHLAPSDPSAGAAAEAALARNMKKSSLDFIKKDLSRLMSRVGSVEKAKLDAHFSAIRDIEKQLAAAGLPPAPTSLAACSTLNATANATADLTSAANAPMYTKMQIDLLAEAIRCDLTRFATFDMRVPGDVMPFVSYLEPDGSAATLNTNVHDNVAHQVGFGSGKAIRMQAMLMKYYAEQVAYLMDKLAAIPEGTGTALDHTIILWGSELGDTSGHDCLSIPIVLAGGANGALKMGQFLNFASYEVVDPKTSPCTTAYVPGSCNPYNGRGVPDNYGFQTPHNQILTSICQAFGLSDNYFGSAKFTGGLPGLKA